MLTQTIEFFRGLPRSARLGLVFLGIIVAAVSFYIVVPSSTGPMAVLFNNMSLGDANTMVQRLEDLEIPYELDATGSSISVPVSAVARTRMALATDGLPNGVGVGFEIFDTTSLGASSFVQRTNYLRALQGELARTIVSLSEIETARVHLVIPKRSLFMDQREPARASIALSLKGGQRLSRLQLKGIMQLVTSAVEGLGTQNVTIVDGGGNLLAGGDESTAVSDGNLDSKARFEQEAEERIQTMLGRIVGTDNIVARVSANFDYSSIQKTEERFDPTGRVAKTETQNTRSSTATDQKAGGIPGAASKIGTATSQNSGSNESSSENEISTNYEVSKTVSTTLDPKGRLSKLTIAVLVDLPALAAIAPGITIGLIPNPIRAELIGLIQNAVGFNAVRGDQLTLTAVPLQVIPAPPEPAEVEEVKPVFTMPTWSFYVLLGIGATALFALLFSLIAFVRKTKPAPPPKRQITQPILSAVGGQEGSPLPLAAHPLREYAKADPERTAQVLRSWINK